MQRSRCRDREVVGCVPAPSEPQEKSLPPDRKKNSAYARRRRSRRRVSIFTESYKLFGVDLTQIPGLMLMVLTSFSEVGRDMSRWQTAGQFVSWLALCPDNDITGGRVAWRGMRKMHNRAGELFRMAAYSLHHEKVRWGTICAG